MTDQRYSAGSMPWLYPQEHKPPAGTKIALLTRGGIQVTGEWRDDGSFIAWQYLFKRDKEKENQYAQTT